MTGVLVITIAGTGAVGHLSERDSIASSKAERFSQADSDTGSTQGASANSPVGPAGGARSEKCSAHRAIRFYSRRIAEHRARMSVSSHAFAGAGVPDLAGRSTRARDQGACPRYLAHVLQRKARSWRLRVERWTEYHYHWWKWLPAKHRRVGACETGYGREPGDFTWDSGTYVSFAGIYRPGYDADAHRVGNLGWDETKRKLGRLPTPREQMQAVDSHRAAHGGWSGWGCRHA